MKKFFKLKYLIVLLVLIQLYRPSKNELEIESKTNIFVSEMVPQEVQDILKTSCFDCHSNNTVYPWYNNVAPVSWWIDHHVEEAKKELNFDAWGSYSLKRRNHKLEEIKELLVKGEMPLESYLWVHKEAKLNENRINTMVDWIKVLYPDVDKKKNKKQRKS